MAAPQRVQALLRVMLDPVQRSEKRCAFSSGPAVRALLRHTDKAMRLESGEQLAYIKESQRVASEVSSELMERARIPTSAQMQAILRQFVPDSRTQGLVEAIVEQGGLDGRYTLEIGKTDYPVVESTLGFNFAISGPLDNMGNWRKQDTKVIVIDGVIQFVHEIHHVLEAAASQKFPLLIVARGFGEDVVQTLRVNRHRRTVDCLPITVPVEIDTLNTPKDISIICNADMISTAKGELISSVNLSSSPTVQEINYRPGQLTISNRATDTAVKIHVKQLAEARFVSNGEVRRLYDDRIKSLSPNHTLVKLPRTYDALTVKSEAQMVANGLRLIRALHEGGVVETTQGIDSALRLAIPERFVAAQLSVIIGTECAILED